MQSLVSPREVPLARLTGVHQIRWVPGSFVRLPLHLVPSGCPESIECSAEVAELWRAAVAALGPWPNGMAGHYLHDALCRASEERNVKLSADLAVLAIQDVSDPWLASRMVSSPRWLEEGPKDANLWSAFQTAYVLLFRLVQGAQTDREEDPG